MHIYIYIYIYIHLFDAQQRQLRAADGHEEEPLEGHPGLAAAVVIINN